VSGPEIDLATWLDSVYSPTPTIIEAAQALYRGHHVAEISRSEAGAGNLTNTAEAIMQIMSESRRTAHKSICFVTGVPGSGKTLAGLNIATSWHDPATGEHAVFLSGNGPLVHVLREALARDDVARAKAADKKPTKATAYPGSGRLFKTFTISVTTNWHQLQPPLSGSSSLMKRKGHGI
jgi:hypothetical protein